jgi:S1-C subfamily serine protease
MIRIVLAVGVILFAAGCSVTTDVYGIMGDERDAFIGSATGYSDHTGTMEVDNGKGMRCVGRFALTSGESGHGLLTCNSGQRAIIQFNGLSRVSGYGFGSMDDGTPVKFTYGLSREQGSKYLGPKTPAASAGGSAGSSSRVSNGTGFYINRQGNVLTNAHVVNNCKEITLLRQGSVPVSASMVKADTSNDLAVLMAASPPSTIAAFRGGRAVRQGESVIAFGFPLPGDLSSGGSLTTGSVSALSGLHDDTRYLQMSAPVQPGNSGGPLLDTSGNVVGIVSSGLNALRTARLTGGSIPQNVNFAIKADVARTFLEFAGVGSETGGSGREFGTPDLGEKARGFSVQIECKR